MLRALALLLCLSLSLGGCVGASGRAGLDRDEPRFDVVRAFAGASTGDGVLKIAFRRSRPVHVESTGVVQTDGSIVIDQVITEPGRKQINRQWRLHETTPNHYEGLLSDAAGPVTAHVDGNCLHIRFAMKGGLVARQWLFALPDGRTVENRMSIRKAGVVVARMKETIRRQDQD